MIEPTDYKKLILQLKPYYKIVITGPQRAGTTIISKILSEELNYEFLSEKVFNTRNYEKFKQKIINTNNFVIQAPCLSYLAHKIQEIDQNIMVIFIYRKIDDIIKSQIRINWIGEQEERNNYIEYFPDFYSRDKPISEIKYDVYIKYQKPRMINTVFLNYYTFKKHPLWIDKKYRVTFKPHQIELKDHDKYAFKLLHGNV
ncbi:MAG: hypothetical protein ACFFG0_44820 [Candidatus Thorarchaeota archaeon]